MKNETKKSLPDIGEAVETLTRYKRERNKLDLRLESEEQVWKGVYSGGVSSWIFNSIINKHADVIDSIPTCICLPREPRDEGDAEALSKIIPVISQRCNFEQTYSDNSWSKLKHGTAVYGVFWNNALEDGLGDIDIRAIPLSEIFWENGVNDIQDSGNLFITALVDTEALEARYPEFCFDRTGEAAQKLAASLGISPPEGKTLVVDWYYKTYSETGKCLLQLCKFAGDCVLYSSEADPDCSDGWYEHGQYPVIFDRLYPSGEGICGFGLISLGQGPQQYINRIDENVLRYSDWASKVRFWAKSSVGVNEEEFLNLDHGIVEVEGDIDQDRLRQIEIAPMDEAVIDIKRMKIEELKEITGSRDVSQGGVTGGVTAASAINILREAGAKSSRDGNAESYRAYVRIMTLVIELIRQFYIFPRIFRIIGEDGMRSYISFDGKQIAGASEQRRPYFDIEVSAIKKSPSEAEQKNQLAKALYDSGALKPENIRETLLMLELMDFEGIAGLKASLRSDLAKKA